MNHQPLPWRITEATEKKGQEIVDARGNTVAKLTTLDMTNATLIVASVNSTMAGVKHITDPNQLEIGREYWLLDKDGKNVRIAQLECADDTVKRRFFEEFIWAEPDNNQAMKYWDIFGPIPLRIQPDFEALKIIKGN